MNDSLFALAMSFWRICLAWACLGVAAYGQTNTTVRRLSLEDCVVAALEHNYSLQISRGDPLAARYSLLGAYGAYDPVFSFSGEHSYDLSTSGTETREDFFESQLSGELPWGLQYELGGSLKDSHGTSRDTAADLSRPTVITNSFTDINTGNTISFLSTNYASLSIRSPFETTSGQAGALRLRQPLLKDFWIDSTRLDIFLKRKDFKISQAQLELELMSTIASVEQTYYNLIYANQIVKAQQTAVDRVERLIRENQARVRIGALAPLDEKQAESQAAGSERDLLQAIDSRNSVERSLKNLLSDDWMQWENVTIEPTDYLQAEPHAFDRREEWHQRLNYHPLVAIARLGLAKQDQIVRFQRNQLLPSLDLTGSYGYNASSEEFHGALDQFRHGSFPFYSYGAQISIPLSQTAARNSFKSAKVGQKQIALSVAQTEQSVLISIQNAIETALTNFKRVDTAKRARLLAYDALEAEQKKLDLGRSTSFVVLRLQKDLTDAETSEIRALADYNISLSRAAFAEATTMEHWHVNIESEREFSPARKP